MAVIKITIEHSGTTFERHFKAVSRDQKTSNFLPHSFNIEELHHWCEKAYREGLLIKDRYAEEHEHEPSLP